MKPPIPARLAEYDPDWRPEDGYSHAANLIGILAEADRKKAAQSATDDVDKSE